MVPFSNESGNSNRYVTIPESEIKRLTERLTGPCRDLLQEKDPSAYADPSRLFRIDDRPIDIDSNPTVIILYVNGV